MFRSMTGRRKLLVRHRFHDRFYSVDRAWRDGDVLVLSFPMTPRVTRHYKDSAVFERGPLVFSLPLRADWQELKKYAEKSADWQLTTSTPWNYGVEMGDCQATAQELAVGATPFDIAAPAVALRVKGRRLPNWSEKENSAGPLPLSPVSSTSPLQTLTLIPYGAAKLRITAFPALRERSTCGQSVSSSK